MSVLKIGLPATAVCGFLFTHACPAFPWASGVIPRNYWFHRLTAFFIRLIFHFLYFSLINLIESCGLSPRTLGSNFPSCDFFFQGALLWAQVTWVWSSACLSLAASVWIPLPLPRLSLVVSPLNRALWRHARRLLTSPGLHFLSSVPGGQDPKSWNQWKGMLGVLWPSVSHREWFARTRSTFISSSESVSGTSLRAPYDSAGTMWRKLILESYGHMPVS
jgi:hypothetical protein